MHPQIERTIQRSRAAQQKAVKWILQHSNPDGSIGPTVEGIFYYRLPWTLTVTGETVAASRLLDWIERNQISPEGKMEGVSPAGSFKQHLYTYPLSILALGAHLRQRFDISYRTYQYLLTRQNPATGGYYDAAGAIRPDSVESMCPTAQAGLTSLVMGDLSSARKAAAWIKLVWDLQPAVDERLCFTYTYEDGLVTEYDWEQAFHCAVESQGLWQAYYVPGIAAAFLGRMYAATREQEYLELARNYQGFCMSTTERQFESAQVCKSGWGSAVLYELTGEDVYLDWTVRLGDWFVETQLPDGHWENTKKLAPNPTIGSNISITTEFVLHLDSINFGLASRKQ